MRIFICLVLLPTLLFAQGTSETFDIKHPGNKKSEKCGTYLTLYSKLPIDIRYGVEVREGTIYFTFPSRHYFELLFDSKTDGIAVDILHKDQYKCFQKNTFAKSWANKGELLPPMYKEEMLQKLVDLGNGYVIVEYGTLPTRYNPQDIECNLLILQKKYLCGYHAFSNIDYNHWGLLEMGLYRDSLSTQDQRSVHNEISKTLHFTIPFEKDQQVFELADIQPLYDSLNITDYDITDIKINAYASIEGTSERNLFLQNERALSIIGALQSYQKPEIKTIVTTNENWVEFLTDISNTRFAYMATWPKDEIKTEVSKESNIEEMELILRNHRKALVELKLQKKFTTQENNPDLLKKFFDQSIAEHNINEALYLQKIIFQKYWNMEVPEDFVGKLEIPETSEFGPLLNNMAVFKHEISDLFLEENMKNFERLLEIIPDNLKISYNLTALKIKAWAEGIYTSDGSDIRSMINNLEQKGVDQSLIRRLMVNYHIIITEYYHQKGLHKQKSQSLRDVYWLYGKLDLSDQDLLKLSKYLAEYSQFQMAESVLIDRIGALDANEDLLFYYIQLTIYDEQKTKNADYRKLILNAIEKNNQRFCDLFKPTAQGGYTFQLLSNEYLRKSYCEECGY